MPRTDSGSEALVRYLQTGDRNARTSYRELPGEDRIVYQDMVNRVYTVMLAHHFGEKPSEEEVDDLIERVAARHPQYGGGVKRVLQSLVGGGRRGGISPRQVLTAQHLVIREIAKLRPDLRKRAGGIVAQAAGKQASGDGRADIAELFKAAAAAADSADDPGKLRLRAEFEERLREYEERRAAEADVAFTGTDSDSMVSVTLGLDGSLRELDLLRGVERMGGRSIAASVVRAWVAAEKRRWSAAHKLGTFDSAPEPGSGSSHGDTFRSEAYSESRLCRAAVDRHGRLRGITFMRTELFDDGRHGLADEVRDAIEGAQGALRADL